MEKKDYTLFELARAKGYTDALCLFLHAKELECLILHDFVKEPAPYLYVLEEAIEDGCKESDILKMSKGNMDYFFRVDSPWGGKTCRELDREIAIKSGEKAYNVLLDANGDFDYQKAYREIIEKHPDFPDIMKKSGHPLPMVQ